MNCHHCATQLKTFEDRIRMEVLDSITSHWGPRDGSDDDAEYDDDDYDIYEHEDEQVRRRGMFEGTYPTVPANTHMSPHT